ncbi:hypothetical protein [Halodesulfovibrio aestuarii]
MEALVLSQSWVSRYLSFLKKTGWGVSRRSGKWVTVVWPSPMILHRLAL